MITTWTLIHPPNILRHVKRAGRGTWKKEKERERSHGEGARQQEKQADSKKNEGEAQDKITEWLISAQKKVVFKETVEIC